MQNIGTQEIIAGEAHPYDIKKRKKKSTNNQTQLALANICVSG